MPRLVPIRRSLLLDFLLVIAVLGGGVLVAISLGTRTAVRRLSGEVIHKTTELTLTELEGFVAPVNAVLQFARVWGIEGMLDGDDPRPLVNLLGPVFGHFGHISVLMIADSTGAGTHVFRQGDAWVVHQYRPGAWDGRRRVWRWRGAGHEPEIEYAERPPDPTATDWFAGAVAKRKTYEAAPDLENSSGRIYWTQPYTLPELGEPAMTAAIAYTDGERDVAIGADVLLMDVSRFTTMLHPSQRGIAFVTDAQMRVIGLPCGGGFERPEACRAAMLDRPEQLGMPVLADGVATYRALGEDVDVFRFRSGGEAWWAGGEPLDIGGGRELTAVVVVPESDVIGDLALVRYVVIGLTGGVLVLAVWRALVSARRLGEPIESLVQTSDRIARLDLDATEDIDSRVREVARLAEAQSRMRRALREFTRYMPTEVVRELVHQGAAARVGGRTRSATVLFSDIVGFTAIGERMTPTELTDHLADYFESVMGVMTAHRGTIDKTMGDAIMAFWGAPRDDEFHAVNAVDAALACVERIDELNARWIAEGSTALPTCFGLASGEVLVGNVGSPRRLSYTAIGDTVNIAAKLENLNRDLGTTILVDPVLRQTAGDLFHWRRIDRVTVRNRQALIDVYEPLGRRGEVDAATLEYAAAYEAAWDALEAGRPHDALGLLESIPETARDRAVMRLLNRAQASMPRPIDGLVD